MWQKCVHNVAEKWGRSGVANYPIGVAKQVKIEHYDSESYTFEKKNYPIGVVNYPKTTPKLPQAIWPIYLL